jgi:hypothetical protein
MNTALIQELDNTSYFIVRNDGVILRNQIGDYNIYNKHDFPKKLIELETFSKKIGAKYTFTRILIADYKKENPSFKF